MPDPIDHLPHPPWDSGNPSGAIAAGLTILLELVKQVHSCADSLEKIADELYHQNRI